MSNKDKLQTFLAKHPRMIGALFMILLLTSQAGMVAANATQGNGGP